MQDLPIVLITGARGGIGRALVAELVARGGLRIVGVSRQAGELSDLPLALAVQADCTTSDGAAEVFAQCQQVFGAAPNLLAHCVGSTLIAPIHRTTDEQWQAVMRTNLDSAAYMLRGWVEGLRTRNQTERDQDCSAVFVSSVVSRIGVAQHEAIAAAKGGVEGLVRSAAATYAPQGLRLNAVAPGMTETPMTVGMLKLPAMREGAGKQYPLGGLQTAQQVAQTIAWLLSEQASRITGQVIAVDGGFTTVRPLVR